MSIVTPAKAASKVSTAKPLFPVPLEACRVSEPCWQCGKLISPRPSNQSNYCAECRRAAAESEANSLLGTARALREGSGVFSVLSVAERNEQLFQLLSIDLHLLPASLLVEVAANAAEEICRRVGSVPESAPFESKARPMTLTELAAEEPYYIGGTVTDAERDDCESRVEIDFDAECPPDSILYSRPSVLKVSVPADPDRRPAA